MFDPLHATGTASFVTTLPTALFDFHCDLIKWLQFKFYVDEGSGELVDVDLEIIGFSTFDSCLETVRVPVPRLEDHLAVLFDALSEL